MANIATPFVQSPAFLLAILFVSIGVLVLSIILRKSTMYVLGAYFGQLGATVVSWIPVVCFGVGTLYFLHCIMGV